MMSKNGTSSNTGASRSGFFKVLLNRVREDVAIINFAMLVAVFFKNFGWHWWYLLLVPPYVWWRWKDIQKVWPAELTETFDRHPRLSQMYEWLEELAGKNKPIVKTTKSKMIQHIDQDRIANAIEEAVKNSKRLSARQKRGR
jgi:hypothetical protein